MSFGTGIYKVSWENKSTTNILVTEVTNTKYNNQKDFMRDIAKNHLHNFYKYRSENPELIQELEEVEEVIVIAEYDDAYDINTHIAKGYHIRGFIKDKCILEKYKKKLI